MCYQWDQLSLNCPPPPDQATDLRAAQVSMQRRKLCFRFGDDGMVFRRNLHP